MENHAGGDSGLVLGAGVEAGGEIIELDGTNRDGGKNVDVDAETEGYRKGIARGGEGDQPRAGGAAADGFVSAANQDVNEGRNGGGEREGWAEEIGLQVRAGGADAAELAAEFTGEAEPRARFVGAGEIEAVEVAVIGGGGDGTGHSWAEECSGHGSRGVDERVAAEEFDLILSRGAGESDGRETEEDKD